MKTNSRDFGNPPGKHECSQCKQKKPRRDFDSIPNNNFPLICKSCKHISQPNKCVVCSNNTPRPGSDTCQPCEKELTLYGIMFEKCPST